MSRRGHRYRREARRHAEAERVERWARWRREQDMANEARLLEEVRALAQQKGWKVRAQ
jgi:hypothetical protein